MLNMKGVRIKEYLFRLRLLHPVKCYKASNESYRKSDTRIISKVERRLCLPDTRHVLIPLSKSQSTNRKSLYILIWQKKKKKYEFTYFRFRVNLFFLYKQED